MRNPKKATTQCLLCRFLHTAKKRGNEKVGGERVPSLSVGDITVAYWGMEWSLQQLSPVTKEDPVEGQRRIKVMYPAMALGNPLMAPSY